MFGSVNYEQSVNYGRQIDHRLNYNYGNNHNGLYTVHEQHHHHPKVNSLKNNNSLQTTVAEENSFEGFTHLDCKCIKN